MLSRQQQGVTFVEVLVAMAIVAILLGLGTPSIATYLQSAKMNSAAQGYLSGIQRARSEAIRRNLPVEFVLTNTPITPAVANAAVPQANGLNWVVRVFDPVTALFELIDSKSANEGSASVAAPSVTINGVGTLAAFTGILPFNGFGATVTSDAYVFDIANPPGGLCATAGGPMRCPRIRVPAGGLARLCDPAADALNDSRGCGP